MPYLKTQQVNFLGILSEWGPDPLRPLPNFCLENPAKTFSSYFVYLDYSSSSCQKYGQILND